MLDVNDNPPKFERPSYSCRLSAEVDSGQLVTVVHADDPDQELLRYSLTADTTAFRVNPYTGKYHLHTRTTSKVEQSARKKLIEWLMQYVNLKNMGARWGSTTLGPQCDKYLVLLVPT